MFTWPGPERHTSFCWNCHIFFNSGTENEMSNYTFRQHYESQSECDLWDVNYSPGVTNVKSQRNPHAAPGSWCSAGPQIPLTVNLPGVKCGACSSGLPTSFRLLDWVLHTFLLEKEEAMISLLVIIISKYGILTFSKDRSDIYTWQYSSPMRKAPDLESVD